jgi:hypothetical protein
MAILTIGTGGSPNDGTGDSIRDAFNKTNLNFAFLDAARQNLTTSNLVVTSNVTINSTTPSQLTGLFLLNGKEIATVGTSFGGGIVSGKTEFTFPDSSSSTTTGAVIISGGLAVQKNSYLSDVWAKTITLSESLSAASINAPAATLNGPVSTGQLTINGTASTQGDITAGVGATANVGASWFNGQNLVGSIRTASQTRITQVGTLVSLAVTGAMSSGSLTTGPIEAQGNVIAANLNVGNISSTGQAVYSGNVVAGNIRAAVGDFANITVSSSPSNFHVTNKGYVNSIVAAFAVALGG